MHRLIGRYRHPKKQEITDIFKYDTSFLVCLFPVENGSLFVLKLGQLSLASLRGR